MTWKIKKDNNIYILPSDAELKGYSEKAISDLLYDQLLRIKDIHEKLRIKDIYEKWLIHLKQSFESHDNNEVI